MFPDLCSFGSGQSLTEIAAIVFPPEPPVATMLRQNGAQRARARLLLARRSAPLPASTVLALAGLDGRRSGDTIPVIPAGELRAGLDCRLSGQRCGPREGRMGIAKGKETAGLVPLSPQLRSSRRRQIASLLF
jgi:hypothetical protein